MTSLRRRVDFNLASQPSREERLARNPTLHFEDSSDEEEERRLQEEEEEEERRLSAINGEATEATSGKRKTAPQTDQEIEAEYAATTKKRKPRITLQPSHVIGTEGLVKIRTEFPTILSKRRSQNKRSVQLAAAYSRSLKNAYQQWAFQLFPGLAMEDVLSRIETFGSKREVKDYMQTMRDMTRNEHLEKVLGKERAEKMLQELEAGLQKQDVEEEMARDDVIVAGEDISMEEEEVEEMRDVSSTPLSNRRVAPAVTPAIDSDSEEELDFVQTAKPTTMQTNSALLDTDDEDEDEAERMTATDSVEGEQEPPPANSVTRSDSSSSFDISTATEERMDASEGKEDEDEPVRPATNATSSIAQSSSAFQDTDDEDDDSLEETKEIPGEKATENTEHSTDIVNSGTNETPKMSPSQVDNGKVDNGESEGEKAKEKSTESMNLDQNFDLEEESTCIQGQEKLVGEKNSKVDKEKDTEVTSPAATQVNSKPNDFTNELEESICETISVPNRNTGNSEESALGSQMTILSPSTIAQNSNNNSNEKGNEKKCEDADKKKTYEESETEPTQTQATVLASAVFETELDPSQTSADEYQIENNAKEEKRLTNGDEGISIENSKLSTSVHAFLDGNEIESSQTQATVLASAAFEPELESSQTSASETQIGSDEQEKRLHDEDGGISVESSKLSTQIHISSDGNEMESSQTQATVLASAAFETELEPSRTSFEIQIETDNEGKGPIQGIDETSLED